MRGAGLWVVLSLCVGAGCGDDKQDDKQVADAGGHGGADAGGTTGSSLALDVAADASTAAIQACTRAPWVLGTLTAAELPAAKIETRVREDVDTFIDDKPPICIDDPAKDEGLCTEMPTGAVVFAYLRRADGAAATDPATQVWCKSENYEDLARIPGASGATKGRCEGLHNLIVDWAKAQLPTASKRSLRYEADVKARGSEWAMAEVTTREEGDVLVVKGPELDAPSKEVFLMQEGSAAALPFLKDDFFGNQYCKLVSPAAALAWLSGG